MSTGSTGSASSSWIFCIWKRPGTYRYFCTGFRRVASRVSLNPRSLQQDLRAIRKQRVCESSGGVLRWESIRETNMKILAVLSRGSLFFGRETGERRKSPYRRRNDRSANRELADLVVEENRKVSEHSLAESDVERECCENVALVGREISTSRQKKRSRKRRRRNRGL